MPGMDTSRFPENEQFLLPGGDVIREQLGAHAEELHRVPVATDLETGSRLDLHHHGRLDRDVVDRIRSGQAEPSPGQHYRPRVLADRLGKQPPNQLALLSPQRQRAPHHAQPAPPVVPPQD